MSLNQSVGEVEMQIRNIDLQFRVGHHLCQEALHHPHQAVCRPAVDRIQTLGSYIIDLGYLSLIHSLGGQDHYLTGEAHVY